jgi:hypothetical protein
MGRDLFTRRRVNEKAVLHTRQWMDALLGIQSGRRCAGGSSTSDMYYSTVKMLCLPQRRPTFLFFCFCFVRTKNQFGFSFEKNMRNAKNSSKMPGMPSRSGGSCAGLRGDALFLRLGRESVPGHGWLRSSLFLAAASPHLRLSFIQEIFKFGVRIGE